MTGSSVYNKISDQHPVAAAAAAPDSSVEAVASRGQASILAAILRSVAASEYL